MNYLNKFVVFILTHGRANNVITYKTLQKSGYSGRIVFIIDNEDAQASDYKSNFGSENVYVFDKKKYAEEVDEGNNFDERRTITFARNACFDAAIDLGYEYFIELDDDYANFDYRIMHNEKGYAKKIKGRLDVIFSMLIDFYEKTGAYSVALAQGGDFIGAIDNGKGVYRFSKRKCMNSFICSPKRRFQFIGAMNEDVNTYTTLGSRGKLFITVPFASLTQKATQSQKGGISDMYLRFGTFCKAFTTVMMMPGSVRAAMMQSNNPRIHHSINWSTTVPQIINEKYRKEDAYHGR